MKFKNGLLLFVGLFLLIGACAKKDGSEYGERSESRLMLYDTDEEMLMEAEEDLVSGALAPTAQTTSLSKIDDFSPEMNTEEYDLIVENDFLSVIDNPLSTFSIDVDTASYANCRRFINDGYLPYPDAVRIEEFINYFTYDYPEPEGSNPFSFTTEMSECPWNTDNRLLHIGLQAEKIDFEALPPNNLVFLLDTSGSMDSDDKLGLLVAAMKLLVFEMRETDTVAIVAYADATGLVLEPTPGTEKQKIVQALDNLTAGGSTAGGAGIELAYSIANEYYNAQANNRVILCTDGDFNVGASSDAELTRMIEDKRDAGIYLTILGFGMGNYKDSKMESLADSGNGNYAYIDNLLEAKKVLVTEMGGTLVTIAKDVKIQIEFNPTLVESYRLIGYENRMMAAEDFDDDTEDAGELGAGHTVTAIYELTLADEDSPQSSGLRYQETQTSDTAYESDELLYIKFRYKEPDEDESILIEEPVVLNDLDFDDTSDNFRFSAAVASFGMILRDSEYKGDSDYDLVVELAEDSIGDDEEGYRTEFVKLVEIAEALDKRD